MAAKNLSDFIQQTMKFHVFITILDVLPPEIEILKGSTLLAGDGENDTAATTREQYSSATL